MSLTGGLAGAERFNDWKKGDGSGEGYDREQNAFCCSPIVNYAWTKCLIQILRGFLAERLVKIF